MLKETINDMSEEVVGNLENNEGVFEDKMVDMFAKSKEKGEWIEEDERDIKDDSREDEGQDEDLSKDELEDQENVKDEEESEVKDEEKDQEGSEEESDDEIQIELDDESDQTDISDDLKTKDSEEQPNKNQDNEGQEALFSEEKVNEIVQELVVSDEISEEEAREIIAKDIKIAEQFKGDPIKLARSYRNMQSMKSKVEKDFEGFREANQKSFEIKDDGIHNPDGSIIPKEKIVEEYRKTNADLTEDLDDDKVYKIAVKTVKDNIEKNHNDFIKQVNDKASSKKTELLKSLSEKDVEFKDEVKKILDHMPANQVLSESFSTTEILWLIKGKNHDDIVKKARADAYKKGKESIKVLGKKLPTGKVGGGSGRKVVKVKLTSDQKEMAVEMFPDAETPKDAYLSYARVHGLHKKKAS